MRRSILTGVTLALVLAAGSLALGCSKGQTTVGASDNAQASAGPAAWAKVVQLGGSLNGPRRGRSGVTVDLTGNALRFVVTYGPAPGWGANHARFRYWLYPVGDFKTAPDAVLLHAKVTARDSEQDSATLRLETVEPLSPGAYQLLYQGSGWFSMTAYQRAR